MLKKEPSYPQKNVDCGLNVDNSDKREGYPQKQCFFCGYIVELWWIEGGKLCC